MTRFVVAIISVGIMVLGAGVASGQEYPNKPLRMIISGQPGGGADFAMRIIAPGLSSNLGQQVIIQNRPSGPIPAETVAKAAPDGYTLLAIGNTLWLGPLLGENMRFDGIRDFSPIAINSQQPLFVVVPVSVPVKSVKELIALANARPGELNYAALAVGTASHLAAELFKAMAGVKISGIAYSGAGTALTDLISGQVQVMFHNANAVVPPVKSGKLRALAVTTDKPSALFPGLPTVAAAGVPGYEAASVLALVAPARTPAAIVNRLNQEIVQVLNGAEVKQKFLDAGVEAVGSSPAELAARMKSDVAKWGKLIKEAGIKVD